MAASPDGLSRVEPRYRVSFSKNASSFRSGDVVNGRYRITGTLGKGGYGAVYAAEHTGTGQALALKMLSVDPSTTDDDVVARFYREARITAGLTDVHTVRVFDVGRVEDGPLFMAMELLRGPELSAVIRGIELTGRRVTQAEAIEIALPVLQSLGEAHKAGLVHRDLKPANVIIATMGDDHRVVKVLDFGIAHTQGSELTSEGQALGTPAYMSPEQVRGKRLDSRADLYSLGVILYRCLAGRPPFRADDSFALAFMHVQEEAPDLRQLCGPEVSDAMIAVVHRALSKDPDDRFQSARDMHLALQGVAAAARAEAQAAAQALAGAGSDDGEDDGPTMSVAVEGSVLRALVEEATAMGVATPMAVRRAWGQSEDDETRGLEDGGDDGGAGDEETAALPPSEPPAPPPPDARVAGHEEPASKREADAGAAGSTPHQLATMALDTSPRPEPAPPSTPPRGPGRPSLFAGAAVFIAVGVVAALLLGRGGERAETRGPATQRHTATPAAGQPAPHPPAPSAATTPSPHPPAPAASLASQRPADAAPSPADAPTSPAAGDTRTTVRALIAQVARTTDLDAKVKLLQEAVRLAPEEVAYRVLLETTLGERDRARRRRARRPRGAAHAASGRAPKAARLPPRMHDQPGRTNPSRIQTQPADKPPKKKELVVPAMDF